MMDFFLARCPRFLFGRFLFPALLLFLACIPAQILLARSDGPQLIRDAEIEYYLRDLGKPIFQAAGIDPASVSLTIVKDPAINAFVAGGMNIFFYTGLLQKVETPDQLVAIIAHETGHISGGHLVRGTTAMANASAQAIIGALVGIAAGVAAGNGNVAIGAIGGAQQIAERSLLSFSRAQESSADAAGLSFLDKAGLSSQGMEEFMKTLASQELLPADRQSEYVRTHPLTQDRIDAVHHHLENSSLKNAKIDPKFVRANERMKAKLLGYLQPETALLRYTDKDPRLFARYARCIALYRKGDTTRALALADTLMAEEPGNPFFLEQKAQILFDSGKVDEATPLYEKAVALLPDSALLRIALAQSMLEGKKPASNEKIIQNLLEANRLEERIPETWRLLAAAWGRKAETTKAEADQALVSYALAEEALAKGALREARSFADRALKGLPRSSPYWLRAQDIKLSAEDEADRH